MFRHIFVGLAALGLLLCGVGQTRADATLTHDYEFNGNFHDSLGGPDITNQGGTLDPVKGFSWTARNGLSLSGGVSDPANYSILVHFKFTEITGGWRKIIDPKNLTIDVGLYIEPGNKLQFYPEVTGTTIFTTNTMHDVILTRDGTSNQLKGYLDGTLEFTANDSTGLGIFNATSDHIVQFFRDDADTGGNEVASGFVDQIKVWDGVLTSAQISGVPEPSSALFFIGGMAAMAGYSWRHRKQAAAV
jgi:hypothetical protein